MFVLLKSETLEISFDPVEIIEKSHPSVSFDVKAVWVRRLQRATLELKESWFEYYDLDKFFTQIRSLKKREIDSASLFDMGNELILRFVKDETNFSVHFSCEDNFLNGVARLKVEISEEELGECVRKIEEWEKWW